MLYSDRKLNRLKGYDYSRNGWYFVTFCIKDGIGYFGEIKNGEMVLNEFGGIAQKCWLNISNHFPDVILDKFIIMPNHIHGIVVIDKGMIDFRKIRKDKNIAKRENYSENKIFVGNKRSEKNEYFVGNKNFSGNTTAPVGGADLRPLQNSLQHLGLIKNIGLSKIIQQYKSSTTREINFYWGEPAFQWQRSFYDQIIDNPKTLNNIRRYIKNNPQNWESDQENPDNFAPQKKTCYI